MTLSGFADDHSIRGSFPASCPTAENRTIGTMEDTLTKIAGWMTLMWLKLNSKKTEFILFGSRQMLKHTNTDHLNFGHTPYTTKQSDQISWRSPKCQSYF